MPTPTATMIPLDLCEMQNCECGCVQAISNIVEKCPRTRFEERLKKFHMAESDSVDWLKKLDKRL